MPRYLTWTCWRIHLDTSLWSQLWTSTPKPARLICQTWTWAQLPEIDWLVLAMSFWFHQVALTFNLGYGERFESNIWIVHWLFAQYFLAKPQTISHLDSRKAVYCKITYFELLVLAIVHVLVSVFDPCVWVPFTKAVDDPFEQINCDRNWMQSNQQKHDPNQVVVWL